MVSKYSSKESIQQSSKSANGEREYQFTWTSVVALHGLNGHRERTWTAKNGTLWLQDLLPGILPNARIMTYGYDSRTHASDELSQQTLYGHALSFCSTLTLFREATKVKDLSFALV